ncbi:MAG TPA: CoA ester lyase [Burkholderiales bacterium]|nr:CoA ester lyase [Burkholderiales bacterium]
MSFTQTPPARARLTRSELVVPGATPALFEKAARSAADAVFLDLEDAVAPDDKVSARASVIAALNQVDWGAKTIGVRINGVDTAWMYRDVIEVVESCPRLDLLVIPKIGVAADVYALDMLVTQIEQAKPRERRVGFEILIETALGLSNVETIAQASPRLEAMAFGSGDLAASLGMRTTVIGGMHPEYGVLTDADTGGTRAFLQADPWHAAQARMLVACRAHGLRPIDGVYGDIKDADGLLAAARRAAVLGFDGKWAIHPAQIAPVNAVFTPAREEIERARRIVQAMEEAAREGRGAVQLDGRLVDVANIRMAENLLRKAEAISVTMTRP